MAVCDEVALNRIAQGIISLAEGVNWFAEKSEVDRRGILKTLGEMVYQSHPLPDDVPNAIEMAGLKPSDTPCVLLAKAGSDRQRYQRARQISELPGYEHQKSFLLLLKVFEISDRRRRETKCKDHCNHWWHQPLSDG
jgi:hypothetical protein